VHRILSWSRYVPTIFCPLRTFSVCVLCLCVAFVWVVTQADVSYVTETGSRNRAIYIMGRVPGAARARSPNATQ
jgi:hypothetical protein